MTKQNFTIDIYFYLDYVNNFLTVTRFAEYHQFSLELANEIIEKGKAEHELRVKQLNAIK